MNPNNEVMKKIYMWSYILKYFQGIQRLSLFVSFSSQPKVKAYQRARC